VTTAADGRFVDFHHHQRGNDEEKIIGALRPGGVKDAVAVPAKPFRRFTDQIGVAIQGKRRDLHAIADVAPIRDFFVRSDNRGDHARDSVYSGDLGKAVADIDSV
jgi:hypothetical protein